MARRSHARPFRGLPPPTAHSHSEPLPTDEDGWDEPADADWSAPLVREPDEPQYDRVWTGRVDGEDRGLLKYGKHATRPAPPARDGRKNARAAAWLTHMEQAARERERSEA